jgi:hypothetical protein
LIRNRNAIRIPCGAHFNLLQMESITNDNRQQSARFNLQSTNTRVKAATIAPSTFLDATG